MKISEPFPRMQLTEENPNAGHSTEAETLIIKRQQKLASVH
jgi:hypothetical protein